MKGRTSIAQRISTIVNDLYGGNKSEFARAVGVSEANIRSSLSGTLPKADVLEKIVNNTAISCDWLIADRGPMLSDTIQLGSVDVTQKFQLKTDAGVDRQVVPLYPFEASAGVIAVFSDVKPLPLDYLSLPDLPPVDGALYIRGDSMYPLLKSGDIVLFKTVTDLQYGIFWGEMYLVSAVIDGEVYNTVKYVQKSEREGFIKLVSHNPHHSTKEIPLEMVRAMAIIRASVRYNTL